jgi:hypothetical protein
LANVPSPIVRPNWYLPMLFPCPIFCLWQNMNSFLLTTAVPPQTSSENIPPSFFLLITSTGTYPSCKCFFYIYISSLLQTGVKNGSDG